MPEPDSNSALQGARDFRTTHWSIVLAAGHETSPRRAEALESLCRTYWPAIYAFVRRRGYDEHTAKDLTQAFFERVLEKNYFGDANAQRGKFRTFLLTSLNHFLANEWDKSQRQKRGGGCTVLSLDDDSAEERYLLAATSMNPETVFDRRWAETVLQSVLSRLRQEFDRDSKAGRFDVLKGFLIGGHSTPSYGAVATQLGMSEVSARSAVSRLRHRFRDLMRDEIAHTVGCAEDVDSEIRYLFEALAN
jgi:RNA polymerase sigma factor (sigma-70 family)